MFLSFIPLFTASSTRWYTAGRSTIGSISLGTDFTVWKLDEEVTIDPNEFLSMGKATPFVGERVKGKCVLTVYGGKIVYKEN